ncbi:hypothetical protein BGZ61DRAFT_476989 [Ilyonectria robusta]|uniref:uncharacterized protein n=1 Tax=Ilyonectria robusta TaxID=1079257 RepID=UPI001E8D6723|nr:uncharacterized protein BGZ61DRAFT_476989 [Ilyonectria robusta]KAH8706329.1 hypothetical protein BGZ61DRAFT_476989 [Ilyonectria robusta]
MNLAMIRLGLTVIQIATVRHHDQRDKEEESRDSNLECFRKLERAYTDKGYVNNLSGQASLAQGSVYKYRSPSYHSPQTIDISSFLPVSSTQLQRRNSNPSMHPVDKRPGTGFKTV